MPRQTYSVRENVAIQIRACTDRLIVIGWDDARTVSTDGEARQDGDTLIVENQSRVTLRVPRAATVTISDCQADVRVENVNGNVALTNIEGDVVLRDVREARVRDLTGDLIAKDVTTLTGEGVWRDDVALRGVERLTVNEIDDDVSMGSIGTADIKTLRGDLSARDIRTALKVGDVEGDVIVRGLDGTLTIERVGEDFAVSDARGAVDAQDIAGDAVVSFARVAETKLRADGDVVLNLPADANAEIELDALRGDLMVRGAVQVIEQDENHLRGKIGSGEYKVQAESTRGDLSLTAGERDEAHAEYGARIGAEFADLGQRIAAEVRQNIQESLGNVHIKGRFGRHHFHARREHRYRQEPERASAQDQPRESAQDAAERKAILDAIARGEISVNDAIRKLRGEG
jgi:hypothetical protein